MISEEQSGECPAEVLSEALAAAQAGGERGLAAADRALLTYRADARLHFLRGSLLAGLRRYEDARRAMRTAIDLAPGFAVARFQLGLLELTSGLPDLAEATWSPLRDLPGDHYLRLFAAGLGHLIRDDFAGCIDLLERGIASNTENLPLNGDMQMMIGEARKKLDEAGGAEPTSAAQMLLQRFGKETKH